MDHEKLIYRIQDAAGQGAYRVDWGDMEYDRARHPQPGTDDRGLGWQDLGSRRTDYYFGFVSEEQMRFWFYEPEWREQMQRAGLRLTVWRAPAWTWVASDAQAIFIRERAELVETRDLV